MNEQTYRIKPPAWKEDRGHRLLTLPYGRLYVMDWREKPGVIEQYTDGWDEPEQIECGSEEEAIKRGESIYYAQLMHWLEPTPCKETN